MRVNVANLSEVLDKAAPGRRLAAAIRSEQDRINRDLATKKFSLIEVDGTNYKILPKEITAAKP